MFENKPPMAGKSQTSKQNAANIGTRLLCLGLSLLLCLAFAAGSLITHSMAKNARSEYYNALLLAAEPSSSETSDPLTDSDPSALTSDKMSDPQMAKLLLSAERFRVLSYLLLFLTVVAFALSLILFFLSDIPSALKRPMPQSSAVPPQQLPSNPVEQFQPIAPAPTEHETVPLQPIPPAAPSRDNSSPQDVISLLHQGSFHAPLVSSADNRDTVLLSLNGTATQTHPSATCAPFFIETGSIIMIHTDELIR